MLQDVLAAMKLAFEGYGEIAAASVFWGLAGILAKKITDMQAHSIIFYRVIFAFAMLFAALLITGSLDRIKLRDKKKYLALFSILQLTTMLAYFTSILEASVSIAVLMLYTAPVYVTVLSPVVLKERATRTGVLALVLSIAGMVLIVNPSELEFSGSIGILAGIVSGVSYALQIMTSKHISTTYSGYTQAFWSFIIAALVLMPSGSVPLEVVSGNIVYLMLLAVFPTLLAVSLYFNGLKKVRASSASILGLIEPVSAVVLAALVLGEQVTLPVMLGGALILIGAAIVAKQE